MRQRQQGRGYRRAMFDNGIGGGGSHTIRDPARLYHRLSTNARVLCCGGGFAGLYLSSSGLVGIAAYGMPAGPWVFL